MCPLNSKQLARFPAAKHTRRLFHRMNGFPASAATEDDEITLLDMISEQCVLKTPLQLHA
jgi:hypothetical protein